MVPVSGCRPATMARTPSISASASVHPGPDDSLAGATPSLRQLLSRCPYIKSPNLQRLGDIQCFALVYDFGGSSGDTMTDRRRCPLLSPLCLPPPGSSAVGASCLDGGSIKLSSSSFLPIFFYSNNYWSSQNFRVYVLPC